MLRGTYEKQAFIMDVNRVQLEKLPIAPKKTYLSHKLPWVRVGGGETNSESIESMMNEASKKTHIMCTCVHFCTKPPLLIPNPGTTSPL